MMAGGAFAGRVAVVLGAGCAGNMGQAVARAFAAEGARVVVAARGDGATAFAAEIGAVAAACDITDGAAVAALFGGVGAPIAVAVNCTGRSLFRSLMDTTADDIADQTAIHLTGALRYTQEAARAMPGGGSIIHISSLSVRIVMPHHVAYMATKAAGETLVRAAALELGDRGIRVNGIAPGLTDTPMTRDFFADSALVDGIARGVPLGRLGTVDDIAAAALWLADDRCFITREILQINGGAAIHRAIRQYT